MRARVGSDTDGACVESLEGDAGESYSIGDEVKDAKDVDNAPSVKAAIQENCIMDT